MNEKPQVSDLFTAPGAVPERYRNGHEGHRSAILSPYLGDRSQGAMSGPPHQTPMWIMERQVIHRRKARPGTCPQCRAHVLTGPDDDTMALRAVADPTPVGSADELRALTAGRTSYDLIAGELERRDQWRLTGPRRHPVLLEHRCEEPA